MFNSLNWLLYEDNQPLNSSCYKAIQLESGQTKFLKVKFSFKISYKGTVLFNLANFFDI